MRVDVFVAAVAGLMTGGVASGQFGGFASQTTYGVGDIPRSVAVGDLDGDLVPDLVVSNFNSGDVSVLLGAGDGTFGSEQRFGAGNSPFSVAIGDLDGDGVPDLAVANVSSGDVSVLLGAGDGTFAAEQRFDAGARPESVAIGDLDGDGAPDLAVANGFNFGNGDVSVLLGAGDGTFAAEQRFGAGAAPASVAIEDLDGDGAPDLAVANGSSDDVSVLLGAGDGTFAAEQRFGAGQNPTSVSIEDLNGDGAPDLAVTNDSSNDVSVLLGAGDGTFAAEQRFGAGDEPESVAIGDLDGDFAPDLAVANSESDDVSVLLGAGDGTFAAEQRFDAGVAPASVAIGDLDGDGAPDLAVANDASDNVSVLINQTGVFLPEPFELLSPPDDSASLPLPGVFLAWPGSGGAPLNWSAATGFATTYTVTIARDAALTDVVLEETGLTATTVDVPAGVLEQATRYYWGVTATNHAGDTGSTPGAFTFTTAASADFDNDGVVGATDLGTLLAAWGPVTP